MSDPSFQNAYDAAVLAMAAAALHALYRKECEDPEVAGVVTSVYADGSVDVQLLNGQGVPVGGYSL